MSETAYEVVAEKILETNEITVLNIGILIYREEVFAVSRDCTRQYRLARVRLHMHRVRVSFGDHKGAAERFETALLARMRKAESALLFILLASAFGQTSPVPYAPNSDGPGPTFTSENLSLSYPGYYSSIRKVDFRNLRFPIFDADGKHAGSISFKNGRYKHDDSDDHYSETLDSIYYLGGSSSSTGGSALVLYSWFAVGGSSSQGGIARVFTLSDGHLRSVQKIGWDTHFEAGQPTDSFDPSTNTLLIRSAHYIPGDAHCCVSAMDVVTFRWDGNRFVQSGIQTELSEYGKSEGKILPKTLPR